MVTLCLLEWIVNNGWSLLNIVDFEGNILTHLGPILYICISNQANNVFTNKNILQQQLGITGRTKKGLPTVTIYV